MVAVLLGQHALQLRGIVEQTPVEQDRTVPFGKVGPVRILSETARIDELDRSDRGQIAADQLHRELVEHRRRRLVAVGLPERHAKRGRVAADVVGQ